MKTHSAVKLAVLALAVCLAPACQPDNDVQDSAEFRAAQEAYDEGEYDEALRRAEALRDAYPESAHGWTLAGEAHDALGDYEQAVASYRRALELEPFDCGLHLRLCDTLDSLGRLDEAIESCRHAVEQEPENARAHVVLGIALSVAERSEEAGDAGRRAIELDPDDAWGHLLVGFSLAELDETAEAIVAFLRAFELAPDDAWFHEILGDILAELGRTEEAIESYRRAIELDPENADLQYFLGGFLAEAGRMEEAIEAFRRAVELAPDDASFHEVLGDALADLGMMEEAIESYRRAVELSPRDADARSSLADALRQAGRPKEAKAAEEMPPAIVGEIVVEWIGPAKASDEEVLAAMVTRVGDELNSSVPLPPGDGPTLFPVDAPRLPAEKFEENIASLYEAGFADRARFFSKPMENGQFRLTVELRSPSKLGAVKVEGAAAVSVEVIVALADLEVGESLDEDAVKRGRDRIRNLYRHRGFADATISYRILPPGEDGTSTVVYSIRETAHLLRKIDFVGHASFTSRELSAQMELPKLEADQRVLERDALAADMERIEEHYQEHGYLNARVENVTRVPVDDETADLVITIFEGEPYTVSAVQVEGLQALARDDVLPGLRLAAGEVYSSSDLKHDLKLIEDEYGRRGYVDARVRPRLEAAGPQKVTVAYEVSEGEQFRVGRIRIEGNVTVDQEVILREVRLQPGELFDTTELGPLRERLAKLGLFQQLDVLPVDSNKTGVKDLMILVWEKPPVQ